MPLRLIVIGVQMFRCLACAVEEGCTPFQLCLVWDDKVRGMVGLGMYWLGIIVCFGIVWFNTI